MKKTLLVALCICLCLFCIALASGWFDSITPATVKAFVLSYGSLAPLIFICLFTLAPLVPIFNAVLAVAGGLIFGTWHGTLLVLIGALSGASVGFFLGRSANAILAKYQKNARVQQIRQGIQRGGFTLVFVLRLIPLFPFDLISYAAGFSTIRYTHYIVATLLGIIPGAFAFAGIGSSGFIVTSPQFYWTAILLVGLSCIALLGKKYFHKKFLTKEE